MKHRNQPCDECPFRRRSAPGWLGPWRAEEIIEIIPYTVFPCHQTVTQDHVLHDPKLRVCAGSAIFMNHHLRLSRNPDMAAAQAALKGATAAIKDSVFAMPAEFLTHHKRL